MDLVKAMSIFVRVVDAGSITAAAAAFELSPTMVGNHLQALEHHLGAKLLHRTTRRQSVTEFGRTYYDRCTEILGLIDDAETLAFEAQTSCKGQLRITAPTIWTNVLLVPALTEYFRRYPEVDLDVVASDKVLDLADNGFEAAIRFGMPIPPDLVARPLQPYRHVLCAAPAYLDAHGVPTVPEDLARHQAVNFGFPPSSEWWSQTPSWRLSSPDGEITIPTRSRLKIDSTYSMRTAALAGMGLAMLPRIMVAEDLAAERLIAVLPDFAPTSRPVNLLYRQDRRTSPKLRSFVSFVIEKFGAADQGPAA
ncbi:LysR family transcriptional regulator [Agrobacterium rhizogenes]|nr:LysR family transcriptional regulator [Rhizobium rhizogenes]NTJ79346.1 LysR family transcriptional regulator [Rhizobium rhizogenes]